MFDELITDTWNGLASIMTVPPRHPPGAITLADLDALIDGIQQLADDTPDIWVVSPTMYLRYEKAMRHYRNWLDRWKAEQRRMERKCKRLRRKRRVMQRRHVRGG